MNETPVIDYFALIEINGVLTYVKFDESGLSYKR